MNFFKCLLTVFFPIHNEFLVIWILIGFEAYLWVQVAFIKAHSGIYDTFDNQFNLNLVFAVTLSMAISFLMFLIYVIFYSIGKITKMILEILCVSSFLGMVYVIAWVFNQSELYLDKFQSKISLVTYILLPFSIGLACFPSDALKLGSYILTGGFIIGVLLYDYIHLASDR